MAETVSKRAFLDAAQAPLHPVARDTLLAAVDAGWADPRRLHSEGRRAGALLDQAREVLAAGLQARPEEVTLHPSGAHALLCGLRGIRAARQRVSDRALTSAVDQAVLLREPIVEALPVDSSGRLDASDCRDRLAAPVGVVALAYGNQEIGTLQPLAAVAELTTEREVPLLVDLGAAWGWVPLPGVGQAYAADAAAVGGPPLGVLAVRGGTRMRRGPLSGAERGLEPATPWVPLALAAAEAWQQAGARPAADAALARDLVDRIRAAAAAIPDVQVVGDPVDRLPHIVTFSVLYVDGESLVHELDRRGFAVASGSACTSDTVEPSHVLAAIGAITHGNVRITLPPGPLSPGRADEVKRFCAALGDAVAAVRAHLGTERL